MSTTEVQAPIQQGGSAPPSTAAAARPAPSAVPVELVIDELPAAPRRWGRWLLIGSAIVLVLVAAIWGGYIYWYEATFFVTTDNAQVTGDLVQVGSLQPGRIVATNVDVGDRVQRDQEIAVVTMPQQVTTGTSGALRIEETTAQATFVSVRAPFTGLIVARQGQVGGTVSAGQPMYTLVDLARIWVRANIEETKVARLRPGQPVEIHLDALGQSFDGRVVSITPASAATFSLLPSQNTSGNFIKVTQLVPVKIAIDARGVVLPLGTSATVRVQVQEPDVPPPWRPWRQ